MVSGGIMKTPTELFHSLEKGASHHILYIRENLATGKIDKEEAIDYIDCLVALARDEQKNLEKEYPKGKFFGDTGEKVNPAEDYSVQLGVFRTELSSRQHPELHPLPASAASTTEINLVPMKWNWKPADLGYVFEAIKNARGIDADAKEFASHFLRNDGTPMPADLGAASKGKEPKDPNARQTVRLLRNHKYEDDMN
jgi:hypothetical protein